MYNVKCYHYPTGYQYRIYSKPVGYKQDALPTDIQPVPVDVYNNDIQDYETIYANPNNIWENPFTGQIETQPLRYIEDEEQKKERSAKNSMSRTVNTIYHKARSNTWDWFLTLTFNPDKVDSFDFDVCVKSLSIWLNHQRRNCPGMRYIVVPELHKSGRWHFHGLFADCDNLEFVDSGHTDHGKPIYNVGRYNLGFSVATLVQDNERVTKYISKYITKELCAVTQNRKRYWCSRNLESCEESTLLLESDDLQVLLENLKLESRHIKVVQGSELTTLYIEMPMKGM